MSTAVMKFLCLIVAYCLPTSHKKSFDAKVKMSNKGNQDKGRTRVISMRNCQQKGQSIKNLKKELIRRGLTAIHIDDKHFKMNKLHLKLGCNQIC